MGGPLENDQFLGVRSFPIVLGDSGQTWTIATLVVAGHDEQFSAFQAFGCVASFGSEQNDSIDLSGVGLGRGVAGSVPSHARADNGNRFHASVVQVSNCG